MVPSQGNRLQKTLENIDALNIPCMMRRLKIVFAANTSSKCTGFLSPVTLANTITSACEY